MCVQADNNIDSSMQYKGELTVVLKYIPAEKNLSLPLDPGQGKNLSLPLVPGHCKNLSLPLDRAMVRTSHYLCTWVTVRTSHCLWTQSLTNTPAPSFLN